MSREDELNNKYLLPNNNPTTNNKYLLDPVESTQSTDSGFLDTVLGAFDYANNIGRSAVSAGLNPDETLGQNLIDSTFNDKQFPAEGIRKDIAREFDLGDGSIGKDDGQFDVGDIGDFALDVGIDLITDPLNYVSFGLAGVAKKGALAAASGIDELADSAKLANRVAQVSPPVLGAIGGASLQEEDDSVAERLAKVSGGAALGAFGPSVGNAIGAGAKGITDDITDYFGNRFGEIDNLSSRSAKAAQDVDMARRQFAPWVRDVYGKIVEDLESGQKVRFFDEIDSLKNRVVERREGLYKSRLEKEGLEDVSRDQLTDRHFELLSTATLDATLQLRPQLLDDIKSIDRDFPQFENKLKEWVSASEKIRARINKDIDDIDVDPFDFFGEGPKKFDLKSEVFLGLPIFSPNINRKSSSSFQPKTKPKAGFKRAKEGEAGELRDIEAAIDLYANDVSKKFLDAESQKNLNEIQKYKNRPDFWAAGLRKYDRVHNFIKQSMLFASGSWLKNTFWDNAGKGYIENGLVNWIKDPEEYQKETWQELKKIIRGDRYDISNEQARELLESGVIDNFGMRSLLDKDLEPYYYATNNISNLARQAEKKSGDATETVLTGINDKIGSIADSYQNILERTTGQIGSRMEASARANHYFRLKDQLRNTDEYRTITEKISAKRAEEVIKELAAQQTQDAFFDYSKVSQFEKAVLKRIMPFYAFYAKNVPYWLNVAIDPERVNRLANLEKLRNAVGDDTTEFEDQGLSDFILSNDPNIIGTNEFGTRVATAPALSFMDAFTSVNPSNILDQASSRISPLIETPLELLSGKDFFTGGSLFPSDTRSGTKNLYSAGSKYAPFGLVDIDDKGNVTTDSDLLVGIDRVLGTLLPTPLLDQLSAAILKSSVGKEDIADTAGNFVLPLKVTTVTPEQSRRTRQIKQREEKKK